MSDPFPNWVYSRLPILRPREPIEKRVFVVANIVTGRRRELATYKTTDSQTGHSPQFTVHDVKWAPDGKRLSFVFRQNLYTIPTD